MDYTKIFESIYREDEEIITTSSLETVRKYKDREDVKIKLIVPDGTDAIPERYFESNQALFDIVFPDSVTYIGEKAFFDCNNLTSITFPKRLDRIGKSAFGSCYSLREINKIPDGLTEIEQGAFAFTRLSNITIPDGVTSIDHYAFTFCENLSNVYIPDSVEYIATEAFTVTAIKEVTVPADCRFEQEPEINHMAFNYGTKIVRRGSITENIINGNYSKIFEQIYQKCN